MSTASGGGTIAACRVVVAEEDEDEEEDEEDDDEGSRKPRFTSSARARTHLAFVMASMPDFVKVVADEAASTYLSRAAINLSSAVAISSNERYVTRQHIS